MSTWFARRRWLLLIVAGVLALFVVAACGDDDDDDGGDDPVATEEPSETQVEAPCEGGPGVFGSTGAGGITASSLQDGDEFGDRSERRREVGVPETDIAGPGF